jgi:hypothetical protein
VRESGDEGFPLGDTVEAFRVGMNVGWERVSRDTGQIQTPEEANAVLAIALQLLHFVGEVSRAITEAYVEVAPSASASKERGNQDLVDGFLSGSFPSGDDLGSRAARFRYDLRSPHAVVLVTARAAQPTAAEGGGHHPVVDPGSKPARRCYGGLPMPCPSPWSSLLFLTRQRWSRCPMRRSGLSCSRSARRLE